MPVNVTLKNIPDKVYEKIKERAKRNRRSINSEVIKYLEDITLPAEVRGEEFLERVRALRDDLKFNTSIREITKYKKTGRA